MGFLYDFFATTFWADLLDLKGTDRDMFFASCNQPAKKQSQGKAAVKKTVQTKKEVVESRKPDVIIEYEEGQLARAIVAGANYLRDPKNNAKSFGLVEKSSDTK